MTFNVVHNKLAACSGGDFFTVPERDDGGRHVRIEQIIQRVMIRALALAEAESEAESVAVVAAAGVDSADVGQGGGWREPLHEIQV